MTQAPTPRPASAWTDAVYRGAVLGVVAACHLALMAILLRQTPYRESQQQVPTNRAHDALQLVFITPVTAAPVARASTPPPPRALPTRSPPSQRSAVPSHTPTNAAPMTITSLPPQLATDPVAAEYQPGDFRARLRQAQGTRAVPLPGSATPPVGGLRLRAAPSARDLMRQLAVSTRCSAMRFDMQNKKNQFITAQLMDRMLEADGCGPHAERTATREAVEALTRDLLDVR